MQRREDLVLVLESHTEGKKDLALGVHATVHALFDTVDRAQGNLGLPSELSLGHQAVLADLSNPVGKMSAAVFVLHSPIPMP